MSNHYSINKNAANLIAHWSFNEGKGKIVEDLVQKTKDPIDYVFNQARFQPSSNPEWRKGICGCALLFDGYSTWITRKSENIQHFSHALTIEAWIAPRSFGGNEDEKLAAIVNQHDREKNQGFILGVHRHGKWSLQVGVEDEWIEIWANDQPLPRNQWSYIAAVFDSKNAMMKLYLNGEEVAEKLLHSNTGMVPSNEDLLIGKNNHAKVIAEAFSLNMFNGLLDEVKLYNRALSEVEIKDNSNNYLVSFDGKVPSISYEDIAIDRSVYERDRHRPQYHLTAPGHWMNEPHAPFYFNGKYHLFYQHNPQGPYWGNIQWGHWVSEDMVHWSDLPVALATEDDGLAPDGIWSGNACYDEEGIPVLFFTAGNQEKSPNQMTGLARSTYHNDGDLNLVNWVKYPNPVTEQPKGLGLHYDGFRDPFVWKEGDTWFQIVGSGIEGKCGTAVVFTSNNLIDWEYRGLLYEDNDRKYPYLGEVWELPILLPIGNDKHIFIISPVGEGADVEVFYWIGTWDRENYRFIPDYEEPQLIDVGDFHFTGPSAMIDPKTGRLILFTIAQGERTPDSEYHAGWAHNGGLPVSLTLRENGRLGVEPIKELQTLRGEKLISFKEKTVEEANKLLKDIKGDMLEVQLEIQPNTAKQYGIKVRRSPNGEEETLLYYNSESAAFNVNREKTTIDPRERTKGIQGGKLELRAENLKLHIYLDRSMVEAYANGLKSLTTRVYPQRLDSLGVAIWGDGSLIVKSMEVWEMNSIHKN
ncbi:GH32 C-terminal domain-containing protein [Bacillus taeanensis]|uniref:beta-fructofuranosidase n=1 Tax=Bacillus taeanensis TaxID=273032 RepID=A0A366XXB0_9BACI|nr:GH32 C-terminal domain-containing protein [Bacillus taeanensis]RBW70772.1 glycoside hydrolase [Bacillus taeanensis]